MVVLHGWGSSAALMQGFSDALAGRFRVLLVDLPGHGAAPPPPQPMGMEDHADALADVLAGGPAHFIGHSNGGRIALYMASDSRYASLVRSLTLVSPSGTRRPQNWRYHLKKNLARALKAPFQILPDRLAEPGLDWLRHTLLWKVLSSSDYRVLEGTMRETFVRLVNTYVEDRLGRIAVPTLLFWGDKDGAVLRAQMEKLEEGIEDAGLVVLEGAGHYGFLDDPTTVLEGTRHFLEELEGKA